ncbi:MAG: ATP-binding protein [Fibromonadales bacterium]|nr:ATP-binding protein [Fibromonadales bacterium]
MEMALFLCSLGLLAFIIAYWAITKNKMKEYTRYMFDATPFSCILLNRKIEVVSCNQAAMKVFEFSSKKSFLERFFDYSPKYQPNGRLSIELATENVNKAFDEGFFCFEWLHQTEKGEIRPCEITLVRVAYENDFFVAAYQYDLKGQRAAIAKVYEANLRMRIIYDTSPLACFLIDGDFNVLECNQEIVKLFNLNDKQEFIDSFFEFLPEEQPCGKTSRDMVSEIFEKVFDEGKLCIECMCQKHEEPLPCEFTLVRVKYDEKDVIAGYIRDLRSHKAMLNEMRKAEIAEASNKAKSKFLAAMSHEIRTPMNAILGLAEINMHNQAIPKDTIDEFEKIYQSGSLLLRLINDMLDLSKIEAGKLEIRPEQYNFASMIHDAVQLNITRTGSKPIEFKLSLDENIPIELVGDELRIKQILNNLLSNAFKYTDNGSITLSVATEPGENDSNITLVFCVRDTGQGMNAEQIKELFGEYTRFNLEANRLIQGVGLGLNISKRLVQMMNGEITVDSKPGKGSAFTMRLPQKIANFKVLGKGLAKKMLRYKFNDMSKMKKPVITREPMPYGRVLVVDDVEMNLYIAKVLMKPYELKIETASSGFEAVKKIRNGNKYDIVFMDHMMPKMDGIETAKLLREMEYTRPIVALTANAVAGQAEIFLENGFDDFISKPIDIRQLNEVLNKFISNKQNTVEIDPALLAIFAKDSKKALSFIEAIFKNLDKATDEDLHLFTVYTHAMKSGLANIGEKKLSEHAALLEKAGREQNKNAIQAETSYFIDKLRAIIKNIEAEIKPKPAMQDENPEHLHEQLKVIKTASDNYDYKTADATLEDLKGMAWTKETKKLLDEISEHLLQSNFEEVSLIIQERC